MRRLLPLWFLLGCATAGMPEPTTHPASGAAAAAPEPPASQTLDLARAAELDAHLPDNEPAPAGGHHHHHHGGAAR